MSLHGNECQARSGSHLLRDSSTGIGGNLVDSSSSKMASALRTPVLSLNFLKVLIYKKRVFKRNRS